MTKMHIEDDALQDYLDGLLDEVASARVERHLAGCAQCSASATRLRTLLEQLAALPAGIAPARDLRPGIHAALGRVSAPPDRVPLRERSVWSARYALIAAAVVLVALTSAVTQLVTRADDAAEVASASSPGLSPEAFGSVQAHYVAATAELEAVLAVRRTALTPETVRILEENLAIIDAALAEAGAALQADPGNVALSEMLVAAYEKKLDLLRRAAEDPAQRDGP